MKPPGASELTVAVHAPDVSELVVSVRAPETGHRHDTFASRNGDGRWTATVEAADGDHYWLTADGVGPLVDPAAQRMVMIDGRPIGVVRIEPWPKVPQLGTRVQHPVIYEAHVKGLGRTFAGLIQTLPYLAQLGVDVIELMPIHPFDTSDNYWGYMPIVWGALHEPYAAGDDPAAELAAFTTAAHAHGLAVWVDVVFNHTGEGGVDKPAWSLRGLDAANAYLRNPDGSYNDDAGCGNVANSADPAIRALVVQALDRYADLGVDGFRFDLASALTRDGGHLVRSIGDWAVERGVTVVAEPWDLGAYQVGRAFPDRRWGQWNDRFREDVRGFLRGEEGLVPGMIQRVSGSPHLFDGETWRSVNFITAHDGLTLHDLTTITDDRRRAWNCGAELRPQQLANAFCYLLLSAGSAMFVMGDEFGRTQHGHDNPYDIDSPLTWVDWSRLDQWRGLHDTVRHLLRLRRLVDHGGVKCFGVDGPPDIGYGSRSLAWATGPLYVAANAWWEPLTFEVQVDGEYGLELATSSRTRLVGPTTVEVGPRSVAVLQRIGGDDA